MKSMMKTVGALTAVLVLAGAGMAHAQSAAAKSTVDAAKLSGDVGEQADGYLGLVSADAPAAVRAAVAEINTGRTAAFREAAAKAGTSVEVAGAAVGKQLFDRLPAGQFYRTADGRWAKK
jgi:uncharacterized protein YdbL (DUF1318 family)